MLVLSRKVGESIRIGNNVKVTVVKIMGNRIRIGVEAPKDVRISREDIDNLDTKNLKLVNPELEN